MAFTKNFAGFMGRLSVTGIIVLSGFQFGSSFYVANIASQTNKVEVGSLAKKIDRTKIRELKVYIQGNEEEAWVISLETIRSWFEPYVRGYSSKQDIRISATKVGGYLASIAPSVNIQSVSAKFMLVDNKAEEFMPSSYGRRLNIEKSKGLIINAIIYNWSDVTLPMDPVEPEITLDKISNLGITTLIGRGETDFKGSSEARIHNIKVGSAKHNGTILKPGEEFSFNSILGEVNEKNGYQSELVIKRGKLTYEAGGGLCQVSTTLFRSAIMAGLPILERRPHSFPVRYYNPQGFDATVYPGVVDLKFKNDTSNHILIQSRIEGTRLIFDIYGPSNERQVALEGPFQHDQKRNGSMKAHFIRKIISADGSTKEERFDSNYGAPAPLERNPLE